MKALRDLLAALSLIGIATTLGSVTAARAAPLGVTPTQVNLDPRQRSDLVAITNAGDDEVRLQVDVFAWDQKPDGQTVLNPTQDILAFPPLLTVAAHETKRIRVGAAAPPGEAEKNYRLVIQELPPPTKEGVSGVQMLTNISMPVFLTAGEVRPDARIVPNGVAAGALRFSVRDPGTGHFLLRNVTATGVGAGGGKIFEAKADGWYVLAGGTRDYELALAAGDCRASKTITLTAQLEESQIQAQVPISPDACGQGGKTQFIGAAPAAR